MAEETEEDKQDLSEHQDLKAYNLINQRLCGFIEDIQDGYAKVRLPTTEEMAVDRRGLVHSGFIFGAASFAAIAAINKPNAIIAVARCNFLAPLKVEDEAIFEARAQQNSTRKRNVSVVGYLNKIKIFDGEFAAVVTDRHALGLQLQDE